MRIAPYHARRDHRRLTCRVPHKDNAPLLIWLLRTHDKAAKHPLPPWQEKSIVPTRTGSLKGSNVCSANVCCDNRDVRFGPLRDQRHHRKNRSYSITSSAIESRPDDMVRPSCLAVARLITRSNFVGRIIGRSPGFSPFRTRLTYAAAWRYAS